MKFSVASARTEPNVASSPLKLRLLSNLAQVAVEVVMVNAIKRNTSHTIEQGQPLPLCALV